MVRLLGKTLTRTGFGYYLSGISLNITYYIWLTAVLATILLTLLDNSWTGG